MKYQWLGIEGKKNEMLFLARLRDLPDEAFPDSRYPHLFVISWSYNINDETGLPENEFYVKVKRFESDGIDKIERMRLGIMVYSETSGGVMRAFLYVSKVEQVSELLSNCLNDNEPVEFASVEDADWQEFHSFKTRVNS